MKFSVFHILALMSFVALHTAVSDVSLAVVGSSVFLLVGVLAAMTLGVSRRRNLTTGTEFRHWSFTNACVSFMELSFVNLIALVVVHGVQSFAGLAS